MCPCRQMIPKADCWLWASRNEIALVLARGSLPARDLAMLFAAWTASALSARGVEGRQMHGSDLGLLRGSCR